MLCSRKYCLRMMVVMGILLITFGVPGKAIGQTTSTYSWGSSSTNSGTYSHANPFGRCYGWEYRVFLYPPNTLSFAGSITNLEFLPSETLSSSGGQIDVWMKTTTSVTSLSSSTSFATYKSGATHVYSNSSSPSFTANSYVSIPLSTPIAYNYNNNEYLMILVRSVANGSSGDGCTSFYYYNPSGASNNTWYGKKDGSDPGENATSGWGNSGTGAYLPVIRVTYTSSVNPPSISTKTVTNITYNAATSGGESISGSSITEKGLVWRTSSGVTTSNYNASGVNGGKSSDGTGTSSFNHTMVGLSPGVTYYVKAYATNSGGTSYGTERFFTPTAANIYNRLTYDSGTDGNGSEDAENLFDQDQTTKWCVINFSSANVIFHSSEPIKPVGYRMKTANDNASEHGRNPKTWTLYGGTSASGSWTPIATVSNNYYMQDVNYTYYTFGTDVSNTAYNYFKLEITGISSGSVMQISEFDFLVPSYNITIGSHTGGSLSTSPSGSAIPGETVTVTATPNSGYQLTALTYNDGSDHSISISSTPYTFTMPSADVTVSATFAAALTPASAPYSYTFEAGDVNDNSSNWIVEESATNHWCVGTSTYYQGSSSLYVTNSSSSPYSYGYSNGTSAVSFAYRTIHLDAGSYRFSYYWKCNGEGSSPKYDYMRVLLAPASINCTDYSGSSYFNQNTYTSTPSGWTTALDGNTCLNQNSSWTYKEVEYNVSTSGDYKLVFVWRNDGSQGSDPGAVDNVKVEKQVTITVNSNNTAYGTVSGGGDYWIGEDASMSATANTGYFFDHWSDGTNTYTDNPLTVTVTGAATYTAYFTAIPYTIANTTDWNNFCKAIKAGHTYYNETVEMTANVGTVTTMAGSTDGEFPSSDSKPFRGTFEGNCHTLTVSLTNGTSSNNWSHTAPFPYLNGATIQNLKIAGSITNSYKGLGGLAGYVRGTNTITNCVVSATLTSNFSGDCTSGGFIANSCGSNINGSVTFNGCAFTGQLNGSGSNSWGGFMGWKHGNCSLSITNCFFAPSSTTAGTTNTYTFSRNYSGTPSNSYYLTSFGTAQGKQALAITFAANPADCGTVSHGSSSVTYDCSCSGITPYSPGLDFNGNFYAGNGDVITLTATPESGCVFVDWSDGSTDNPHYLTVSAAGTITGNFSEIGVVTIGSGTSTSTVVPTYVRDKYSLTQQIFTSSEIGTGACKITHIGFYSATNTTSRNLVIYMQHTNKSSFSSGSDWVAQSNDNIVFSSGTNVSFSSDSWSTIELTEPFEYDGTSNLLVTVDDNTGSYPGGTRNFYVYSTGENRAIYIHSDGTNYNPASSYSGYLLTSNSQTKLKYEYIINAVSSPVAGGTVQIGTNSAGTDVNASYVEGTSVQLKATPTNANWVFYKWNDGNTNATRNITVSANATYTAYFAPLSISSNTEWDYFTAAVNNGFTYSGETVTMTDDVTTAVTTMAGNSSHSFQGTFNGQCYTLNVSLSSSTEGFVAPFHYVTGATIKNLKVTGSCVSSASGNTRRHNAGLVGNVVNVNPTSVTIENCLVSVNVGSTSYKTDYCGGLIGHGHSGNITIIGSAYTGTLYVNGTNVVGGLLGWADTPSGVTITDCYFGGTYSNSSSGWFHPVGVANHANNISSSNISISNCYYTHDPSDFSSSNTDKPIVVNSTNKGKHAYTLDMVVSPTAGGTVSHTDSGTEYGCSGITAYATGLAYDIDNDAADELLLGDGESATITATANSGYTFMNWTDGSSTPTGNPYAVTMGAANRNVTANFINQTASNDWTTAVDAIGDVPSGGITISSGNVTIGNREGLAWVISMVNALNGVTAEDAETFAGLTYTLTADVDMSAHTWVPIGTVEHPFSGTFNGNGHVIKGITRSTDFPHDGLFGYVSGSANIQNVVVQASLTGNSHATGAVVGTFASTGTISNVEGAGTLTGGTLTTALGGIAGNNSGTLHSSFGVATMTGGASATQMGGLVGNNTGNLYNSYSNATYAGTSATKGGLVGSNSGTVENCYAAGIASGVSAFAGSNSGTIQYCYTDAVGSGYIGTSSTAPTGSGTYGAVQSSIKHLDYMYRDNLIAANTNTYVGGSGVTNYVGNHIPVWNGLVSALNQWVRSNPRSLTGLAPWYRPISSHINGDLPVLGFAMDNSLGTLDSDGKFLQYGSNQNGGNGLDAMLTTFNNNTASIFHYGKATGVANVPTSNVKVSIAEDAVLLQGNGAGAFTATVGVTFDNSDHGQHAYDFWGNKLNYDWHLLSTPLSNLKTGAVHSTYQASGDPHSAVDITSIGGYFPANLITPGNPAIGGAIKWDFYTYYEPEYHWINLKRNKNNHYHQDSPNGLITYSEADQDVNGTSAIYIPGKGYEMAISQDTYMNASGTLNRGNVSITLTNQEPGNINYAKGWNLVGNPYQAYLDIDEIGYDPIYTYDADQGLYVPYTKTASANPAIVSQYIHPHQAFFVRTDTDNATLTFEQSSMATTSSAPESYFRDKVNYPLVNLFAEDETGHRDLTVVEFHRPELGGAAKLDYMRTAPFSLAAHYSGKSYGILFATDDIERVPVHFKPAADGLITLSWSTHNGEFSLLKLVDNKLGVEHNMLADNSYSFMASADDYSSRFYITYECSGMGIDENDEGGASTGSATFAYINNGNIVVDVGAGHGASLQVIDVLGRVLYSQEGLEGACTVSTSGLAKGVYILRLSSNQGIKTQKIVVQ